MQCLGESKHLGLTLSSPNGLEKRGLAMILRHLALMHLPQLRNMLAWFTQVSPQSEWIAVRYTSQLISQFKGGRSPKRDLISWAESTTKDLDYIKREKKGGNFVVEP